MKSKIAEITKAIAGIKGNTFASLTYLTKKSNELSRFTVNLGFSYHNAVVKSVTELEIIMDEIADKTSIQFLAAQEVMESLKKTLAAHAEGKQNDDYTKAGQYVSIGNGLNLNTTDNTLQLFGLVQSKVVLQEGVHKAVKSAPMTIEKNKFRKQLTVSKFREFALDETNIGLVKVNGDVIDLNADFVFEVNQPVAFTVNPTKETDNVFVTVK